MKKQFGDFFNIRNKLIIVCISLVLIPLVFVGMFVNKKVVEESKDQYTKRINSEIELVDNNLNNYILLIEENTDMFSKLQIVTEIDSRITSYINKEGNNGLVDMKPLESNEYEKELYKLFETFVKFHPEIEAVFVGVEENGGYLQYPAKARKEGYDGRERDWYKLAMANPNKVNFSDVYTTQAGDMVVSSAVTIKDSRNSIKGVIGFDINLRKLSDLVKNISIGENGYIILTDKKSNILSNPKNKESISKPISDLNIEKLKDLKALSEEDFEVKLSDSKEYRISVKKSTNSELQWNYVILIEKGEFYKSAKIIGKIILIVTMVFIIIGVLLALVISNKIAKPIVFAAKYIELLGKGDFTHDIPIKYLNIKDEIGQIINSTSIMQNSIKKMLSKVKDSSMIIENQTEALFLSSEEMASSSEQVVSVTEDVAKGTSGQAIELVRITNVINDFGEKIQHITMEISEIDNKAVDINNMASESNEKMKELMHSVNNIKQSFVLFINMIMELGIKVEKINEITSLINSVAEQTNLLALNAAIEAARAGEAGKGFSVVAEEIRKLAEQTKKSSEEISKLINNISQNTDNIVNSADSMNEKLTNQVEIIDLSLNVFKGIIEAIEEIIPKIYSVNTSSETINGEKNNILDRIESASAISEEISASTEEISASTEQMSTSASQVASSAEDLSNMAKNMMDEVNKFKL